MHAYASIEYMSMSVCACMFMSVCAYMYMYLHTRTHLRSFIQKSCQYQKAWWCQWKAATHRDSSAHWVLKINFGCNVCRVLRQYQVPRSEVRCSKTQMCGRAWHTDRHTRTHALQLAYQLLVGMLTRIKSFGIICWIATSSAWSTAQMFRAQVW